MKQSDDPKAFFEKYQFNLTMSKPHPDWEETDVMRFEGLEADYVSTLERQVRQLEEYIALQNQKIDFLMNRDFYMFKDKIKKGSDD